jgi:hypothetical protein
MLERTERDAPVRIKLVERSDRLVLEMAVFIIARVWLIFASTINKHDLALLLVVGILSGAEGTRRTRKWGARKQSMGN